MTSIFNGKFTAALR